MGTGKHPPTPNGFTPGKRAGPRRLAPFEKRLRERVGELSELKAKETRITELKRLHLEAHRSAIAGVAFVTMLLETRRPEECLVFIGRSARPLYAMAKRLAPYYKANPKEIRVIDVSTALVRRANADWGAYEDLKTYVAHTVGGGQSHRARLVDTMQFTNNTTKLLTQLLRETGFNEVSTRTLYDAATTGWEASDLLQLLEDAEAVGHAHAVDPIAELQRRGDGQPKRILPVYRRASTENKLRAWTIHQALQDATQNAIASLEAARAAAGRPPVPKQPWKR